MSTQDKEIPNPPAFPDIFLTCQCDTPELYPPHLGDGGYDWCKNCNQPIYEKGTERVRNHLNS